MTPRNNGSQASAATTYNTTNPRKPKFAVATGASATAAASRISASP